MAFPSKLQILQICIFMKEEIVIFLYEKIDFFSNNQSMPTVPPFPPLFLLCNMYFLDNLDVL